MADILMSAETAALRLPQIEAAITRVTADDSAAAWPPVRFVGGSYVVQTLGVRASCTVSAAEAKRAWLRKARERAAALREIVLSAHR